MHQRLLKANSARSGTLSLGERFGPRTRGDRVFFGADQLMRFNDAVDPLHSEMPDQPAEDFAIDFLLNVAACEDIGAQVLVRGISGARGRVKIG
jgi:hypothetical protein